MNNSFGKQNVQPKACVLDSSLAEKGPSLSLTGTDPSTEV